MVRKITQKRIHGNTCTCRMCVKKISMRKHCPCNVKSCPCGGIQTGGNSCGLSTSVCDKSTSSCGPRSSDCFAPQGSPQLGNNPFTQKPTASEVAFESRYGYGNNKAGSGVGNKVEGGRKKRRNIRRRNRRTKQKGRGYNLNLDQCRVGGLSVVGRYDDCSPPKLDLSNDSNCQQGGAYRLDLSQCRAGGQAVVEGYNQCSSKAVVSGHQTPCSIHRGGLTRCGPHRRKNTKKQRRTRRKK